METFLEDFLGWKFDGISFDSKKLTNSWISKKDSKSREWHCCMCYILRKNKLLTFGVPGSKFECVHMTK